MAWKINCIITSQCNPIYIFFSLRVYFSTYYIKPLSPHRHTHKAKCYNLVYIYEKKKSKNNIREERTVFVRWKGKEKQERKLEFIFLTLNAVEEK